MTLSIDPRDPNAVAAMVRGRPRHRDRRTALGLLVAAAALVALSGCGQRDAQAEPSGDASASASSSAISEVRTVTARSAPADSALRLPARVEPVESAQILSRASGIVESRDVDIGDTVKAGQRLALISAPEVEQSLQAARAALGQATARERLAKTSLDRAGPLLERRFVSENELDTLAANLAVAQADTAAARAEVRRLEETRGFQDIRAPFAGVIAARGIERGDRVGSDGTTSLFQLARIDELRVIVDVPQSAALGLTIGSPATLRFRELPGEDFTAVLARRAGAIDPSTGSMRVELTLANPGMRLPAGLRGEVELRSANGRALLVPANAVQVRDGKTTLATIDAQRTLRFVPVTVDRTVDRDVVVSGGLAPDAQIVVGLNALLREGDKVRIAKAPADEGKDGPVGAPAKKG